MKLWILALGMAVNAIITVAGADNDLSPLLNMSVSATYPEPRTQASMGVQPPKWQMPPSSHSERERMIDEFLNNPKRKNFPQPYYAPPVLNQSSGVFATSAVKDARYKNWLIPLFSARADVVESNLGHTFRQTYVADSAPFSRLLEVSARPTIATALVDSIIEESVRPSQAVGNEEPLGRLQQNWKESLEQAAESTERSIVSAQKFATATVDATIDQCARTTGQWVPGQDYIRGITEGRDLPLDARGDEISEGLCSDLARLSAVKGYVERESRTVINLPQSTNSQGIRGDIAKLALHDKVRWPSLVPPSDVEAVIFEDEIKNRPKEWSWLIDKAVDQAKGYPGEKAAEVAAKRLIGEAAEKVVGRIFLVLGALEPVTNGGISAPSQTALILKSACEKFLNEAKKRESYRDYVADQHQHFSEELKANKIPTDKIPFINEAIPIMKRMQADADAACKQDEKAKGWCEDFMSDVDAYLKSFGNE